MSVASDINDKVQEAIAAQEDGDYATAKQKINSALMLMASTPDTRQGGDELKWDRQALLNMIKELDRQRSGSAGIRRTKIDYVNPTT